MTKVLLGMSGGVDSSVSAILLQQQGYEVIGATLALSPLLAKGESIKRAQDACEHLGIKHISPNYTSEFLQQIQSYFIEQYRQGFTPNPCVRCNKIVKFPALIEVADAYECEKIATGHYANITKSTGDCCTKTYQLRTSRYREKDQSYMLYGLSQDILSRTIFPLANVSKDDVNACALKANLHYQNVQESMDNCFIEKGTSYTNWLQDHGVKACEGSVVDIISGKELGRHSGHFNYTIGQRKGLNFGGGSKEPYYVIKKDVQNNIIYIGPKPELYVECFEVSNLFWTSIEAPTQKFECEVKTRYRSKPVPCCVEPLSSNRAHIKFADKQERPAAGQSAVFYSGDICLGGGIIA